MFAILQCLQAIETREKETMLDYIEKGLDVALTPSSVSALVQYASCSLSFFLEGE